MAMTKSNSNPFASRRAARDDWTKSNAGECGLASRSAVTEFGFRSGFAISIDFASRRNYPLKP
jgi:hypothetical protein